MLNSDLINAGKFMENRAASNRCWWVSITHTCSSSQLTIEGI